MSIVKFNASAKFKYTTDDEGEYHSYDDLPAIEYLDETNTKIWMWHGLIHRESQKAAIIFTTNYNANANPHNNPTTSEFYDEGVLILRFENNKYFYNNQTPKWQAIIYLHFGNWIYERLVIRHSNNKYYAHNFENQTLKKIQSNTTHVIDDTISPKLFDKINNKILDEPAYKTLDGNIYIKSKPEKIDMDNYYIIYNGSISNML